MTRTTLLRGPCLIVFNSEQFHSKDDVLLTVNTPTFDIVTSSYGKVDTRLEDVMVEVSFTPCGEWEALATLFPWETSKIGSSIFGAADKVVDIWSLVDGTKLQLKNGAVTKPPEVIFAGNETRLGSCTITGLRSQDGNWADANSVYQITTGGTAPASTFDPAAVATEPCYGVFGSTSPWDKFFTYDGFRVSITPSMSPFKLDDRGTIDFTLDGLEVTVACKPSYRDSATDSAIVESDILALLDIQGGTSRRGSSLLGVAEDLLIYDIDGDLIFTAFKSAARSVKLAYGLGGKPRNDEIEFVACRTVTGGDITKLFQFGP
jgi:hypothetical protein